MEGLENMKTGLGPENTQQHVQVMCCGVVSETCILLLTSVTKKNKKEA